MARRNKGRFVPKNEELPAENNSESKEASVKSSEPVAKVKAKPGRSFDTIALFVVGLIVGLAVGALIFYSMGTGPSASANPAQMNAAGQKAVQFLADPNDQILPAGTQVTLVNITPAGKSGMYQMSLNITYQGSSSSYTSFVSPDGNLLCPSGIIISDYLKDLNSTNTSGGQQTQPDATQACAAITKSDKPVLESFIVSRCPYGLQMQRIIAEVIKNAPDAASYIKVRYIGSVVDGKVTAMHGDAEAQENLAQICMREEQPAKYWPYVSCQMASGNTTGCLSTAGIDQAQLAACMNDSKRGVAYAQKDFELADQYGVSGSPTMIVNGKTASEFDFAVNGTNGRSAQAVKDLLCCGFNTQPAFCTMNMNTAQAATGLAAAYSGTASGSSGSCG